LKVFGAKKFSAATVFLKKFFLIFFLKLDEKLHKMTEVLFNFDFSLGQKVISKSVDFDKNMIYWNNFLLDGQKGQH